MPLPDLIEIEPLTAPVTGEVTVPGSKSITNRALVLAALARGRTRLYEPVQPWMGGVALLDYPL